MIYGCSTHKQATVSSIIIAGYGFFCLVLFCFFLLHEFLVSKETVVLRRWERSKQKFGFIKRVDKG